MLKKLKEIKINRTGIISIAIISIMVVVSALMTYQYSIAKKWSNLIYPNVKIEGQDVSGKTKDEAKKIMNRRYESILSERKLIVEASGKKYELEYKNINPKYNVDEIVDKAYSYGKNDNFLKKYYLIKWASTKEFKFKFTYDTKVVEEFINNVEKETNKNSVDASINTKGEKITVVKEQNGKKLKKDKLSEEIKSKLTYDIKGDINIKAPIDELKAKITSDKIKDINSKISSFSTNYGGISSEERANNIKIATNCINGKVLMPGDIFSFNDIVGERTAEKGYMSAPVIIGNQVDSGLGGGICQVSSTLYNAVLRANIKPTERVHHTLPSHYVPLGLDATVDYENIDYKFKNTLKYPIYIEGDASDGEISFGIYSNSELTNVVTEVSSQVYETIEAGVEYVDDLEMAEGTTEIVHSPSTGYKVKVIMKVTQGGKTIEEVLNSDFYRPVQGLIKRGVKKPVENKEAPVATDPNATTPPATPNSPGTNTTPDNSNNQVAPDQTGVKK